VVGGALRPRCPPSLPPPPPPPPPSPPPLATAFAVAGPFSPHSARSSAALPAVGRQQAPDVTPATTGVYTLNDAAQAPGSTPRTVAITAFSVDWGRGEWRVAPANLRVDGVACTADALDGKLEDVFRLTYDGVMSAETKTLYPHPSRASA